MQPVDGDQGDLAPAKGSAVDQVLAELRSLIADGGLTVGDRLPTERELCDRFNASRNTVREAMRMLKAFGVVEVRPKVGATIVDQRMNRAFDLFSFNVTEISRQTFDDIQGFILHHCELIIDRVHLGMEFQAGHTVSDVNEAGTDVFFNNFVA